MGKSLLHYAVIGKFEVLSEILLDKGASFDIADNLGRTPLEYAAMASPTMVSLLLRYGDDPSRRSAITACQFAAYFDQEEAFEILYWQICELDNRVERFQDWRGEFLGKFEVAQEQLVNNPIASLASKNESHREAVRINALNLVPAHQESSLAVERVIFGKF